MKKLKKLLTCFALISVLPLASCQDLGAFEDEQAYYDSFDEITFINTSCSKSYYELKDIYNSDTVNNLSSPVTFDKYSYICIQAEKDMTIDDIAFYYKCDFDSETKKTFSVNIYVQDKIPSVLRDLDRDLEELKKAIEESRDPEYEENDEPTSDYICSSSRSASLAWDSFHFETFTIDGENKENFTLKEDYYIVIQIQENTVCKLEKVSTVAELQAQIDAFKANKISFTFTNLMLRAL